MQNTSDGTLSGDFSTKNSIFSEKNTPKIYRSHYFAAPPSLYGFYISCAILLMQRNHGKERTVFNMKKVISACLLLTAALSLAACGKSDTKGETSAKVNEAQQETPTSEQSEFVPVPLGDFSAQDFDGNDVSKDIFAEYDLTMVNLWTTTCSYCIEEMPVLNELRKEFQDGGIRFNIISVCMDVGNTEEIDNANLKKAKEIIEKTGVEYPTLIPDKVLLEGRLNGIQAFPESFFVDSEGNVVSQPYVGAMPKNHWRVTMKNEIDKMTQDGMEE